MMDFHCERVKNMFDYIMPIPRPHYDNFSMLLYVMLGLLSMWAVKKAKILEIKTVRIQPVTCKYYVVWFVVWVIIAVFREVAYKIGGTDALNYIGFFDRCMHPNVESFYSHFYDDVFYLWVNQLSHVIYPDYHVFFFVAYGFFILSFVYFCIYFVPKRTDFAPFVLLFYLFLRSFNTIRSNFAISVLMVACVFLLRRKYVVAFAIAVASVLFHKSSALFAMVIPFCWYFRERMVSLKLALCLEILSMAAVPALQIFAIDFIISQEIDGAYSSYIKGGMGNSFWVAGWTIAFEQMLLGVFMLVNYRRIKRDEKNNDALDISRIRMLWNICVFDMLLIPINFGLHIWRGYEYFYVARLALWGYLLYLWLTRCDRRMKTFFKHLLVLAFIAWMVFRVYNTWEPSGLMPYVFDLF